MGWARAIQAAERSLPFAHVLWLFMNMRFCHYSLICLPKSLLSKAELLNGHDYVVPKRLRIPSTLSVGGAHCLFS